MIKVHLVYDELISRVIPNNVIICSTEDTQLVSECIDLFNAEIKWDGMFTIDDAINRFKHGQRFFVGYYKDTLFGYCWVQTFDTDTHIIFNVFSKHTDYKRTYGATDILHHVIKNELAVGNVIAYVDDWNVKSLNVFNKLGFKQL